MKRTIVHSGKKRSNATGRQHTHNGLFVFTTLFIGLLNFTPVSAAPTSSQQAEIVARNFTKRSPKPMGTAIGASVSRTEIFYNSAGESLYYVVYMDPSGFIVVPANDLVEPIIAISSGDQYAPSPNNPFGALVSSDLQGRMGRIRGLQRAAQQSGKALQLKGRMLNAKKKWYDLSEDAEQTTTEASLAGISDVWVSPLVQSRWSQTTVSGNACYNYYTPPYSSGDADNYPCGCVATAMAQLMRFHQHPIAGVGVASFDIEVDGSSATRYLLGGDGSGGSYDWANMVLVPGSGSTLVHRQAIGALCHDAGVAVEMSYASGGSGADTMQAANVLESTFDYDNAVPGYNSGSNFPDSNLRSMINPNLDSKRPVLLGITGSSGGHAIVCDGYGFSGETLYHHLNMGWAGSDDAWYNLPTIETSYYSFSSVYKTVYNVFVSGSGEIISGRVVDESGQPVADADITADRIGGGQYTAVTDSNGIYALAQVPSSSTYTVHVSKTDYTFHDQEFSTGTSSSYSATGGNVWGVNFTNITAVVITPTSGLAAEGPEGGPFTPTNKTYNLQNISISNLPWIASCPEPWITITPASGILATGTSNEVTVSINAYADGLEAGSHTTSVIFSNMASHTSQSRPIALSIRGAANLPFTEGFESGTLNTNSWWESTGTEEYRTEVTASYEPHTGSYHLTMDDSVSAGSSSRNELTLLINLKDCENVVLSFWAKSFSDEADGPPTSPFIDGADFDGVAISEDGTTWYEVQSLRELGSTYQQLTVDLDAAIASHGMSYNSLFRIRFNQYDNYPIGSDGIAIDDIEIMSTSDTDGDRIPDWWEILYFGHPSNCAWNAICANGLNTMRQAYVAGMDPTDPASCFMLTNPDAIGSDNFVIEWSSVSGRVYSARWTDNLTNAFQTMESNIQYPRNSYTDTIHSAEDRGFYDVVVELQ